MVFIVIKCHKLTKAGMPFLAIFIINRWFRSIINNRHAGFILSKVYKDITSKRPCYFKSSGGQDSAARGCDAEESYAVRLLLLGRNDRASNEIGVCFCDSG